MVKPLARALGGQRGWGLTGGLCFTGVVSLDRAALCTAPSPFHTQDLPIP